MGGSISGGSLAQRECSDCLPHFCFVSPGPKIDHNSAVFIIHKAKDSIQSYPRSRTGVSHQTPLASSQKCLSHSKCFPTASLASMTTSHSTTRCLSRSLVQILRQEGWLDTPQLQSPVPHTHQVQGSLNQFSIELQAQPRWDVGTQSLPLQAAQPTVGPSTQTRPYGILCPLTLRRWLG